MTDTTPRIRVALAGVTGWAGAPLARGIVAAPDLHLVAGIARRAAGKTVGDALGIDCAAPIVATAAEALAQGVDVFFEYSKPDIAIVNVLAALQAGAHGVVGTSGLSDEEYARIDAAARAAGRGVLACGNFAITAVLLQKFAEMAVKWLPDVELIDYAKAGKADVPSGTVRELSVRLGAARGEARSSALPLAQLRGPVETRGAEMSGIPVHAIRVPGFVLGVEVIFGAADQRLHLRHEAGGSAEPYVPGALLAIRRVAGLVGVVRGLDRVMQD
ncbi:MAG: 4-hydroxy-tetrahydrodipicolinate reductase [Burkholderiales bacterium]|nr:4-hydroxy-tetrahydrodipicolinate reductase [Burkholderiales bacterium]